MTTAIQLPTHALHPSEKNTVPTHDKSTALDIALQYRGQSNNKSDDMVYSHLHSCSLMLA